MCFVFTIRREFINAASVNPSFVLGFWATPVMTVAHLVFAAATTAYILIAIQLEERDLMDAHPEYAEYRRQVPMIIPFLGRVMGRRGAATPAARAA